MATLDQLRAHPTCLERLKRLKHHHPIFGRFERWRGEVDPGWQMNFLGVRTREEFTAGMTGSVTAEKRWVETEYPPLDEEYLEWIDVLEAVVAAAGTFTMVELGAGWGRWLMNAAAAAQQHDRPFHLVGVEAEPTHFRWMQQHFRDNAVDPAALTLIKAAVAAKDGRVRFHVGDPSAWYGQAIDASGSSPNRRLSVRSKLRRLLERQRRGDERTIVEVRAVTLTSILRDLDRVDLIDLDVQGVEADVLESTESMLSEKVKRVHVGTHSTDNEDRLRALFGRLGWKNLNDYRFAAEADTPWGAVTFQDGVQTWENPRLGRG
jgi:FkbM family methyltransferase